MVLVDAYQFLTRLKKSKEDLERISRYQGASVGDLENQLKQTKEIYSRIESSVEDKILMNLMKLAESSDTDGNQGQLSYAEIQATIEKIEAIHGIEIDGEALIEMITANGNNLYGKYFHHIRLWWTFEIAHPFEPETVAILMVVKKLLKEDDMAKSKLFRKKIWATLS